MHMETCTLLIYLFYFLGSFVRVFGEEDINNTDSVMLSALLFQDKHMREIYQAYPEVLICDSTYKTNKYGMPLFVLICVDGNNDIQIAGVFFTASESAASLSAILKTFKEGNKAWSNTCVVITDKDLTERKVFKELFPQAKLQLCLWHVLRTFNREVTVVKMGMHEQDLKHALSLLERMAHSRSVEDFDESCNKFKLIDNQPLQDYFVKNWYRIKEQWASAFKYQQHNMGELTTSRLENLNRRIKAVTCSFSSLTHFFDNFHVVLKLLRQTRNHNYIVNISKQSSLDSVSTMDEKQYRDLLTPYAFRVLKQEIDSSTNVITNTHTTTIEECSCWVRQSKGLPCRHIFNLRTECELKLYSVDLIPQRWTRQHYKDVHNCHLEEFSTKTLIHTSPAKRQRSTKLSTNTKFTRIMDIAKRIANMASTMSTEKFRLVESNLKHFEERTLNDEFGM